MDNKEIENNSGETTPPRTIEQFEIVHEAIVPELTKFDNKENDFEHLKKIQEVLNTYKKYKEQLKGLGKESIEEVVEEVKSFGAVNSTNVSDNQVNNFEQPNKL